MRILISGGGTGGHIFPGVALFEKIKQLHPPPSILFVCTNKKSDREILEHYNIKYEQINSLGRTSILKSPILAWKLVKGFLASLRIFRNFSPDIVIGLGGFASFCSILTAVLMRKKIFLLEQNYLPGLVNRIFLPFAENLFTQFEIHPFISRFKQKIKISRNPVRSDIKKIDRIEAKRTLNLDVNKKTIGIFGGSQGADFFNKIPLYFGSVLKDFKDSINIIQIAGKGKGDVVKKCYEDIGVECKVFDFTFEMGLLYSACDLVISRAGGNAIAELEIFDAPVILIPFPFATEDHQILNARIAEKKGLAKLIIQKELNCERFTGLLKSYVFNFDKKKNEKEKVVNKSDASLEIIKHIILTMQ